MELKRVSQDSSISSSEESIAGCVSEKPNAAVHRLVNRLKESAHDKNIVIRPATEDEKLRQTFPWVEEFHRMCRRQLGTENITALEHLMGSYIGHISTAVIGCYGKPNRAARLKSSMTDTLYLFHSMYKDIKSSLEQSSYLEKMSDLLAYFIDMEIKASKRGKENIAKIGSKITTALYIFLDSSQDYILDTVLKTKLMAIRSNWELCVPIFNRVLMVPSGQELFELTYARLVFVFRMWKKCMRKADDRKKIMRIAANRLVPPSNIVQSIRTGVLRGVLPRVPKNRSDVTLFLMQAKFCLSTKVSELFKTIKDPKHRITLDDHLSINLDKPAFFEGDTENENDDTDDEVIEILRMLEKDALMNNIWTTLCMKSSARDRARVANVVKTPPKKISKVKGMKKNKKKNDKAMKTLAKGLLLEKKNGMKNVKGASSISKTLAKLKANGLREQGILALAAAKDNSYISDDDVIIIEDTKIKTEVLSPEQPMQDCIDEDANQHEDSSFVNVTKHDEIPKLDINDKVENVQVKIPDVENIAQSPDIVKNLVIDEIVNVERNSFIFKDENMPHSDDDTILDVENSDSSSLPSKIEHIISNTCIENTDVNQNAYEEVNECRQEEIHQYELPTDFSQKEQVRLVIRNATQINESTNPTYTPKFKTPAELKERFNPVLNYEGNVQMRVVETDVNNPYAHASTSSYNHEQNVKSLSMMQQPSTSLQNHDNMRFITPAQLKEGLSQTMNAMQHNDKNLPQVSGEILRYSQEDSINSLMALQRSVEYQQMSPTTEAQHHEPQPSGSNQQPIQNPINLEHCNLLSNYCDYYTNMNNPAYNYANQSTVVLPEFTYEQPQVETREVYEPPPTTPVNTVHRTQTYSPPIPSNFFFFPNFSEQFIKNATFFEPDKQLDSDLDDDKGETTWLHKIVMRRDNYMFLIQQKARQLLLKNEHVMIPPAPEEFKILEPKMRCSCEKCHDNLKNLWTNYMLLSHHRKSKEMLEESSSIKGLTIEDEKLFEEMDEQVKDYLIRARLAEPENSWSLPLKKRKAISHLQPPKDNSDSISYPSTPMLSIAVLEESKLTGADLNVNTRNYYLPRYTNVNIPPPTHGYNPHMVPSSSQPNVQIPNRSYEAMLSNLCSPPPPPPPPPYTPSTSASTSRPPPTPTPQSDRHMRFQTPAQLKEGMNYQIPQIDIHAAKAAHTLMNIAHSSKSYYVEPPPPRQTETKPKPKGKTRGTRGRKRKHT